MGAALKSDLPYKHAEITDKIIAAFYKVYNTLGYGFLEKVYENAMVIELRRQGLEVTAQAPITVFYDDNVVGEYFADLCDEHDAQLLNYLKATPYEVGLLLNFGPQPQFKRKAFENTRKEWWMQKNHPRVSA